METSRRKRRGRVGQEQAAEEAGEELNKNGASREEWNETVQQEYEHKKAERPDRLVCAYFLASRDARGAHEQSHP